MLKVCLLDHPFHFHFHFLYLHKVINKLMHLLLYARESLTFLPPISHSFSTFFLLKPCTRVIICYLLSCMKYTYFWLLLTRQPFLSSHENVLQTNNMALFWYEVHGILPKLSQIPKKYLYLARVNQSRPKIGLWQIVALLYSKSFHS